jgi:hypothetical protein
MAALLSSTVKAATMRMPAYANPGLSMLLSFPVLCKVTSSATKAEAPRFPTRKGYPEITGSRCIKTIICCGKLLPCISPFRSTIFPVRNLSRTGSIHSRDQPASVVFPLPGEPGNHDVFSLKNTETDAIDGAYSAPRASSRVIHRMTPFHPLTNRLEPGVHLADRIAQIVDSHLIMAGEDDRITRATQSLDESAHIPNANFVMAVKTAHQK